MAAAPGAGGRPGADGAAAPTAARRQADGETGLPTPKGFIATHLTPPFFSGLSLGSALGLAGLLRPLGSARSGIPIIPMGREPDAASGGGAGAGGESERTAPAAGALTSEASGATMGWVGHSEMGCICASGG